MSLILGRVLAATNRAANCVVIAVLKSRVGPQLGRSLAVVEYRGRRSGLPHRLVVRYFIDGQVVRIVVGMAEHKTWWRNFQEPHRLQLRLAGVDHDAMANVVRDGHVVSVVADL